MKYEYNLQVCNYVLSPSVWREWIEISRLIGVGGSVECLPPCGGSGLKYEDIVQIIASRTSPSVWREWIEIAARGRCCVYCIVSLRVEGVD